MGLRGIRSTAQKVLAGNDKPSWRTKKPPWEKKGLKRWERVREFINILPITAGSHAGRKMKLRPWQEDIIRQIYGDGPRTIRTAVITLPRKNGKSFLTAALIMAHMGIGPETESRGQVFAAASDREQSSIIFREVEAMLYAVPEFRELFNVRAFHKQIECLVTGTTLICLSSDARKAHGLSPSFVCVDEAAQIRTSTLWDNLSSGTAARDEPLSIIISTQSPDPNHFLSQMVDYGRKIAAGDLPPDPSFLLVEYSAPMDADPWEESVWYECNPALGDFRSLEEMRTFAEQAKKIPQKEQVFRSLYLNQPVADRLEFVSREAWESCSDEGITSGPCFGGLDLGSSLDLTSLILYFPETGAVRCWFWLPGEPSLAERGDRDRVPYPLWKEQKFLETWPGKVTDHKAAALRLAEIAALYDFQGCAYDRWHISQFKLLLDEIGADIPMVEMGQGYKDMTVNIEQLERLILSGDLNHGNNPCLNWNMSNIAIQTDPAGNRKFAKDKSIGRIDGAVALAMAVGLAAKIRAEAPPDFEFSLEVI